MGLMRSWGVLPTVSLFWAHHDSWTESSAFGAVMEVDGDGFYPHNLNEPLKLGIEGILDNHGNDQGWSPMILNDNSQLKEEENTGMHRNRPVVWDSREGSLLQEAASMQSRTNLSQDQNPSLVDNQVFENTDGEDEGELMFLLMQSPEIAGAVNMNELTPVSAAHMQDRTAALNGRPLPNTNLMAVETEQPYLGMPAYGITSSDAIEYEAAPLPPLKGFKLLAFGLILFTAAIVFGMQALHGIEPAGSTGIDGAEPKIKMVDWYLFDGDNSFAIRATKAASRHPKEAQISLSLIFISLITIAVAVSRRYANYIIRDKWFRENEISEQLAVSRNQQQQQEEDGVEELQESANSNGSSADSAKEAEKEEFQRTSADLEN